MAELKDFADRLKAIQQQYRDTVEREGKAIVLRAAKEIFEKCPTVAGIRWTQYTPHWRDGDTCYFEYHGLNAKCGDITAAKEAEIAETEKQLADRMLKLQDAAKAQDYKRAAQMTNEVESLSRSLIAWKKGNYDDELEWTEDGIYEPDEAFGITQEAFDMLNALDDMLRGLGDALQLIFDDHVMVTLLPEAEDFEVTEFSHD